MDYRLDLFNALKNYQDNATADDHLFCYSYNTKEGDSLQTYVGDMPILAEKLSDLDLDDYGTRAKATILNAASYILQMDDKLREHFITTIKQITESQTLTKNKNK